MKRLTALGLLFIFLFNLGGYLLLFQYFIYRSDSAINQRIRHNNYKRTELVQMKIPVHMPAVVNWDDYEQISGEVQINGYSYNYVGLKVTRDTMFMLCLPNFEKTRLVAADAVFGKQVNDNPSNKRTNNLLPKLSMAVSKYDHQAVQFVFMPPVSVAAKASFRYLESFDQPTLSVNGQPPEVIA